MEIPSYFRRYLHEIQPSLASRRLAVQLHNTLRDRLAGDDGFSDWYDSTFLYGSYKRNTAIQPIKDVDICVVLGIDHKKYEPEAVVQRLRSILENIGYEDKTALQQRSVRIDMSGTTLDVVPVIAANGMDAPLYIPDRKLTKWVTTHPKQHLAVATRLNQETNKQYIPFVKMVKAWHRYQQEGVVRPKPKGFTLEALVAQYQDAVAPTYAEAFVNFLDNVWNDCGSQLSRGVFPAIKDPGLDGQFVALNISVDEAKRFGAIVKASLDLGKTALTLAGTRQESALAWREIFGPKFPTEPAIKSASFSEATEDNEPGDLDEEITEVDLPPVRQLGRVTLKVGLAHQKFGQIYQSNYPSGSRTLNKNTWLKFSIVGASVQKPYDIRWIVENHGAEAASAGDLGLRQDGSADVQWERTGYRGSHTMICELHRNGILIARTRHAVKVRQG